MAKHIRPVTDAERARVRELHAQNKGRNEIAEAIGRSAGTITNLAREMGLSFDRSATAAATEAKKIRSEEHTSELQSRENLVCRLLLEKKKRATMLTPHRQSCHDSSLIRGDQTLA